MVAGDGATDDGHEREDQREDGEAGAQGDPRGFGTRLIHSGRRRGLLVGVDGSASVLGLLGVVIGIP